MKIDFPYPNYREIVPFEVPDENLMGIYSPRVFKEADEQSVIARASPIRPTPPGWRRRCGTKRTC